jgi:Tfp pilus assembly protein PilW
MVGMTIGSFVLGGITSTYTFLLKTTSGIGNYVDMNNYSRLGLETFARDARMASDIIVMSTDHFSFHADTESGNRHITYHHHANNGTLTRRVGPQSNPKQVVMRDIETFSFKYYNLVGNLTTNVTEAKKVQISLKMKRMVIAKSTSEEVISARFTMRNRLVSN